jgi:hypothetical protein
VLIGCWRLRADPWAESGSATFTISFSRQLLGDLIPQAWPCDLGLGIFNPSNLGSREAVRGIPAGVQIGDPACQETGVTTQPGSATMIHSSVGRPRLLVLGEAQHRVLLSYEADQLY